jgi:hypothetical protein
LGLLTIIYIPGGAARYNHAHGHTTGTQHAEGSATEASQQSRDEETHDEAHEAHEDGRHAGVHAATDILCTQTGDSAKNSGRLFAFKYVNLLNMANKIYMLTGLQITATLDLQIRNLKISPRHHVCNC